MQDHGKPKTVQKKDGVFECFRPEDALPVIFDSPHSGTQIPDNFKHDCDRDDLRSTEDSYVCDLFSSAPNYKAAFLKALFTRSYIDVNRSADDIDPLIFTGTWPAGEFGQIVPTNRSDSGIGLIPRLIKPGRPIYNRHLNPREIKNRIDEYYTPYHTMLEELLENAFYHYGAFWHINCHSMPNNSAYPKHPIALAGKKAIPADIVLSDRNGNSCNKAFAHALRDFWSALGYRVAINDPFKGAELITRYAHPTRGKNSLQIEINRTLYMCEETRERNQNYNVIKDHCTEMTRFCTEYAQNHLRQIAAD